VSTLPDPCGRAAAMRQKLARFPAAVHILVADAAINICNETNIYRFCSVQTGGGSLGGKDIAADAEVGRIESYVDAGAREREDHGKAQRANYAAHGGCWPAGHIRVILAL